MKEEEMKSLKDIIGPVRTNKKERKKAQSRKAFRVKTKNRLNSRFGPDKSLLHQFRKGNISRSSLRNIPVKKYKPIVKDNINAFGKNKDFFKSKQKKDMFDNLW